ncbi:MAG: hypothetical protein ABI036_13830 [Fibrobacteria bacterium]
MRPNRSSLSFSNRLKWSLIIPFVLVSHASANVVSDPNFSMMLPDTWTHYSGPGVELSANWMAQVKSGAVITPNCDPEGGKTKTPEQYIASVIAAYSSFMKVEAQSTKTIGGRTFSILETSLQSETSFHYYFYATMQGNILFNVRLDAGVGTGTWIADLEGGLATLKLGSMEAGIRAEHRALASAPRTQYRDALGRRPLASTPRPYANFFPSRF